MNAIYLILIALGFSAGIIVSVLDSNENQTQNNSTEKEIEDSNSLEPIHNVETNVNILDLID